MRHRVANRSASARTLSRDECGEPAYADTAGATRRIVEGGDGTQPGDPAKAGAAIRSALADPRTPLRLPLGDDAVEGILGRLDAVRTKLVAWEGTSRSTNIDD